MSRDLYEGNSTMPDEFHGEFQNKNIYEEQLKKVTASVIREMLVDDRFKGVEKVDVYYIPPTVQTFEIDVQ